jgi:hypothetical protein
VANPFKRVQSFLPEKARLRLHASRARGVSIMLALLAGACDTQINDVTGATTAAATSTTVAAHSHSEYLAIAGGTMTGPLLAPSGSGAAPGLAFSAESTLGLYRSAAGTVAVNGAAYVTGDVGIGTSTMIYALNFADGASIGGPNGQWKIQDTGNGQLDLLPASADGVLVHGLRLAQSNVTSSLMGHIPNPGGTGAIGLLLGEGSGAMNSAGDRILEVRGGATTYLAMDGTGKVGIGAGLVAPSERLHVSGNLRVQGTVTDCTLGDGVGGTSCSSDARLKDHVVPIAGALERLETLRGVEFDWNERSASPGRRAIGLIAQDVQKAFPTAVSTRANGFLAVDYAVLVAPLIQAVKELKALFQRADSSRERLESEVASLRAENAAMRADLESIKRELRRPAAARN